MNELVPGFSSHRAQTRLTASTDIEVQYSVADLKKFHRCPCNAAAKNTSISCFFGNISRPKPGINTGQIWASAAVIQALHNSYIYRMIPHTIAPPTYTLKVSVLRIFIKLCRLILPYKPNKIFHYGHAIFWIMWAWQAKMSRRQHIILNNSLILCLIELKMESLVQRMTLNPFMSQQSSSRQ